MKKVTIFLAFALGCLLPLTSGHTSINVSSPDEGGPVYVCVTQDGAMRIVPFSAACPQGQRRVILQKADSTVDLDQAKEKKKEDKSSIDKTILDDLNRRLRKLENMECASIGKNRVVAPFEVVDRAGKKVFSVIEKAVGLFNSSGQPVARMVATAQGGLFISAGGNSSAFFGLNESMSGLGLSENKQLRVELGKNPQSGSYRLNFRGASGETIAAIGVPSDSGGLAFVRDQSGITKATIGLTKNGAGLIEILGDKAIAQMTEVEMHHGGKLWIGNAGGVGMVEAGDAGGFGIVRAGPLGFEFIPTPGLALPGSVIVGKR
jgi:hypothetical protein